MLNKRLLLVLAVLGTLVLAAPVVSALDSYIRIVQITYNSGDVLVAKSASDSPSPASDFQPLNHDAVVVTEDGIVEIEFENEIVARVAEDSRMHLAELLHRDDGSRFTQLSLQAGTATFIAKLREGDEFIVSTPFFTVLSNRKARFRIDLGEQGGRIQVSKGKVEVQTSTEILTLSKGRQLEWDAASSQIALAELSDPDGWDEWNADRDDTVQAARRRERWSSYAGAGYYGNSHYGHYHRWGYCPYSYGSYAYGYGYYPTHYYSYSHIHWGLFGFGHHYYPSYWSYSNPYYTSYYSYSSGHWRHRRTHRRHRTGDEFVTRLSKNRPKAAKSVLKTRGTTSTSSTTTSTTSARGGFNDANRGRRGSGYGNRRTDWTGRRGTVPTAKTLNWSSAVSTTRKSSPVRARETFERDTPRSNGTSSASSTTPVRYDRTERRKSAKRTSTSEEYTRDRTAPRTSARSNGYTRDRTSNSGPSTATSRSSKSRSSSTTARRTSSSNRGSEASNRSRSSSRSSSSASSSRGSRGSSGSRSASSSSRSRGSSNSSARRSSSSRSSSSKARSSSNRSSRSSSGGSRSRSSSRSSRSSGSSSKSKSKKN